MPATSFSNLITFSRGTNATVTDSTGRLTYAPNNLFTLSEQFDNAAWSKFATTVTANATTAPDGTTTADRILETTGTSTHLVAANAMVSVVTGQSYTISVYVKPSGRNWFRITSNFSGGSYASFDIANGVLGTVSGGTASITDAGNGWWRCSLTVVATSTGTASPDFRLATSNATISYAGNASLGVFLWGAQMEAVTYQTTPSTYYPTTVKNLLGYSQDFSNAAWSKVAASITGCPYVNPVDGLFTAQKLMEDTANTQHYVQQAAATIAGAPCTASVYVKGDGRNVRVFCYQAASPFTTIGSVTVDLSNGSVLSGSGTVSSLGNGWYRISVTGAAVDTSTRLRIDLASGATLSYTGDGNSGIYIYGAQLSDSASLDPYVPTPAAAPSSTAYYGPRFDYDPVTLAPKGLLVEEARTNLFTRSEAFDDGAWPKINATITANATTAPDGTTTADKIVPSAGVSGYIYRNTGISSGSAALSIYVKAAEWGFVNVIFGSSFSPASSARIRLSDGVVTSGSGFTAQSAGNGWYRITGSSTYSTATDNTIYVIPTNSGTSNTNGDGASGIFVWGGQMEAGAFATSYIPTVASTVTRSADVATITGSLFSGWYNQAQGTFVAKMTASGVYPHAVDVRTDSSNNVFFYAQAAGTSRTANLDVTTGGATQASLQSGTSATTPFKMANSVASNDFRTLINAGTVVSDTSGSVPSCNQVYIGCRGGTTFFANGHIQTIQYIPNATSDTQLQTLSTG